MTRGFTPDIKPIYGQVDKPVTTLTTTINFMTQIPQQLFDKGVLMMQKRKRRHISGNNGTYKWKCTTACNKIKRIIYYELNHKYVELNTYQCFDLEVSTTFQYAL